MTTIDVTVGASADDADEQSVGTVNLTGNPLLNTDGTNEWNGWIFRGITIPAGATIDEAHMTFQFTGATLDEPDVTIYGIDTGSTISAFTTGANNISSRARTTASVNYSNTDAGASADLQTPDLKTIIQELVDTYSYSSGDIGLVWTSRANDVNRDTSVLSYDGSTSLCARLHIEYTAAGGTVLVDIIGTGIIPTPR